VAYFSLSGNTRRVAELIHSLVGGDLFEITTVVPYPQDYGEATRIAQAEKSRGFRPQLSSRAENFQASDLIFLGYPNWWGDLPMALYSFMEEYDFSQKTVAPFCAHGGSGMSQTERTVREKLVGARVLPGLAIRGSRVRQSEDNVKAWSRSSKFLD
jgi:flavodoxin